MQNSTKYDEDLYNARCQLIYVLKQLNNRSAEGYRKPEQSKDKLSNNYNEAYTSGYKSGYNDASEKLEKDINDKISGILNLLFWVFILLLLLSL